MHPYNPGRPSNFRPIDLPPPTGTEPHWHRLPTLSSSTTVTDPNGRCHRRRPSTETAAQILANHAWKLADTETTSKSRSHRILGLALRALALRPQTQTSECANEISKNPHLPPQPKERVGKSSFESGTTSNKAQMMNFPCEPPRSREVAVMISGEI